MWRRLKNTVHLMQAILANVLYGFPSRKIRMLCVTGTDGKTTTSTLLYHILKSAGKNVALISTVAAYIGDEEIDTGFHVTNPSSYALQGLLSRVARSGMEYCVLEVTSHGIDQNRNWGIKPEISAITNVTHEHLDYHKTYENYLATKARLLLVSGFAVLNKSAKESFDKLKDYVATAHVPFAAIGVSDLPPRVLKAARRRFGSQVYNLENTAVAYGICRQLKISDDDVAAALKTFTGVKGRMETIPNDRGINIIVDFAHTPNALQRALESVRATSKGRLIVVFGCAGARDRDKRPSMGKIASELADLAVFTAEDPRDEDVWTIIAQMKSGVTKNHDRIVSIADRGEAIAFAIKQAKASDTIIVTGKGHERSMNFGGKEYDWSDQSAILKLLQENKQ